MGCLTLALFPGQFETSEKRACIEGCPMVPCSVPSQGGQSNGVLEGWEFNISFTCGTPPPHLPSTSIPAQNAGVTRGVGKSGVTPAFWDTLPYGCWGRGRSPTSVRYIKLCNTNYICQNPYVPRINASQFEFERSYFASKLKEGVQSSRI